MAGSLLKMSETTLPINPQPQRGKCRSSQVYWLIAVMGSLLLLLGVLCGSAVPVEASVDDSSTNRSGSGFKMSSIEEQSPWVKERELGVSASASLNGWPFDSPAMITAKSYTTATVNGMINSAKKGKGHEV
eukprot:GHVQ01031144.1.p1 GENE.GHVQ01031144.1~~GHVQ01031144.1.p1  ORF type:complete len:131 (+),score=12.08 GHVQ01031144.1:174-566(+)